jgi:predicted methyltransferase
MTLLMILSALAGILTAPGRTIEDQSKDAARRPAEVLVFAGVQPGWRVGEYTPGGGYFTRLLSPAVGEEGRVYAWPPSEIVRLLPRHLSDAEANAKAAPLGNVIVLSGPNEQFAGPELLDLVFTAQNYHDLHTRFAPLGASAAFNAAVFRALKSGGLYVIVDHRGPADADAPDRLHRIDPSRVRAEVEAAGFRLEAQGALTAKPRDQPERSVFDPAVRGRTDQFMLRFRKP